MKASKMQRQKDRDHHDREGKIIVRYKYDLNLFDLSDKILNFLELEKKTVVPKLDQELQILNEKIKRPQFLNARRLDLKAIDNLESRKQEILSGIKAAQFKYQVQSFLDQYAELGIIESKAVFGIQEEPITEDQEKGRQRGIVIAKFLDICKNFVPIEVEKKHIPKYICDGCQRDLEEAIGPEDSSEVVCPDCGMISEIFKPYTGGSNMAEGSDYEDRENFIKAKEKFQGKQSISFNDKFYKDLDDFFSARGLPTGDQVRKMDKINGRRGQKGVIGKKILRKALGNKGYNNHYDDINLICYFYWNWDLPDISYLDETLESDYDKTEKIFKQIKGPGRKATINTQWRLRAHLLTRGYPVQDDDFKVIETASIIEQYRKWWQTMIKNCGDPTLKYVPV